MPNRRYKGCYDTDFSCIAPNKYFPSNEVLERNRCYRFCDSLYDGSYADNKYITYNQSTNDMKTSYKVMPVNLFRLLINKIVTLFFSGEVEYKTGTAELDSLVARLIEKYKINDSLKSAVVNSCIFGDCICKAHVGGVSTTKPFNGFKIVDVHNKSNVIATVLYEFLYKDRPIDDGSRYYKEIVAIRFEIHTSSKVYEHVFEYSGGCKKGILGKPIECIYKGRRVSKDGNIYENGVNDCSLVSWLSTNIGSDCVYGESQFEDIKDLIFTLERRLSSEAFVLNENEKPLLIVGQSNLTQDKDGNITIKSADGRVIVQSEGEAKPEYVQWDGNIDNSITLRENLMELYYILTEMNKSFISGEFSGNLSTESLNNCIKGALDKVNRLYTEIYYSWRDIIYCECKLNGIDIKKEDITWSANIGRVDDEKLKYELIKICADAGILSKQTCRAKYLGYTEKQNEEEEERIAKEKAGVETDGLDSNNNNSLEV